MWTFGPEDRDLDDTQSSVWPATMSSMKVSDDADRTAGDILVRARRPLILLTATMAVTVAALAVAGVVAAFSPAAAPGSIEGGSQMLAVSPGGVVDPADVPEEVAILYREAHDHADLFAQIPCFCGCDAMLGHRHLLDCFARPDGGWEAHAMGCGVCLGEAEQIRDLLATGVTDAEQIRTAVVAEWGDPYMTN